MPKIQYHGYDAIKSIRHPLHITQWGVKQVSGVNLSHL